MKDTRSLAQDYPDDAEAQLFYALALLATAQPTDKSYANQHRADDPTWAIRP